MTDLNSFSNNPNAHLICEINGRVIIHLDVDCFYAQVEHRRLSIPTSEPLAVQQWDVVVAVNYVARERGVKRFMRAKVKTYAAIKKHRESLIRCQPRLILYFLFIRRQS